uniref:Uncharacterized protein n=1 Tax=Romanomermis culicivorax TaxID=13658 RepID=A0A915KY72_ROMCU
MHIDEMDDQRRKHLHRNGAPKKDEKVIVKSFFHYYTFCYILENYIAGVQSKGPGASLLSASSGRPVRGSRKTRNPGIVAVASTRRLFWDDQGPSAAQRPAMGKGVNYKEKERKWRKMGIAEGNNEEGQRRKKGTIYDNCDNYE